MALLAALIAAGWWWGQARTGTPVAAPAAAPSAAGGSRSFIESLAPRAGLGVLAPTPPDPDRALASSTDPALPPEGMSADQWRDLQDALKHHPRRAAEIARVTETMAYMARLERYRGLQRAGSADLPSARALAGPLLAQLPTRVAQREIGANEALALQAALLETLIPDPTARAAQAAEERQRIEAALPASPDLATLAARDARFQREQSALLARWNQRPASERDTQQLAAALQALRQSIYDAHSNPAEPSATLHPPAPGAPR